VTLPFHLNRRHKAALFLTLLGVGASLISGAGFQQGTGIMILGAAFAWAFGSDSRFIHSLFAVFDFALLVGPLAYDWYSYRATSKKYQERVAEFERRIPEFARDYERVNLEKAKALGAVEVPDGQERYIALPDGRYIHVPANATPQQLSALREKLTSSMCRPNFLEPDWPGITSGYAH